MASDDIDEQFGRVILGDALGRLDQLKQTVANLMGQAQDVRFTSSLRADVARNEINQKVAQINEQDEELARLQQERVLLDAALDSAEGA